MSSQPLSYTITPAENGKYVLLTTVGDITREAMMQCVSEADKLGAELDIRAHLIDVTASRNVESALANYKFNADVRSEQVDRRACIAILVAEDDHSHDLYVTLANVAGLDLTLFRNRAEAIAHLEAAADRLPPRPTPQED